MIDNELKNNIHSLKKQLRLAMNGVVSSSMRDKGLNYQLNFGVSIPQLKQIAEKFRKDNDLAAYCWQSNSREMKILSAMLQPLESFTPELMDHRMKQMPSFEITQYYCMYIFQYLPFAEEKALNWIKDDDSTFRITGYLLLSRLFMIRKNISPETASLYFECAKKDIFAKNDISLKSMIINSLKRFGQVSAHNKKKVLDLLSVYEFSEDTREKEWYEDVKFDLDYFEENNLNS